MTHTLAILDLSQEAYDEIKKALQDADYSHCFLEEGTVDMSGIGLQTKLRDRDPPTLAAEIRKAVVNLNRLNGIAAAEGLNVSYSTLERGELAKKCVLKELMVRVSKEL